MEVVFLFLCVLASVAIATNPKVIEMESENYED